MAKHEPRAYYVDDEERDAQDLIQRLNQADGLHVEYLRPPADLALTEVTAEPALFFIDWELNAGDPGTHVSYKGGTFATRVREEYPEIPTVLVTRESVLDEFSRRRS